MSTTFSFLKEWEMHRQQARGRKREEARGSMKGKTWEAELDMGNEGRVRQSPAFATAFINSGVLTILQSFDLS